MDYNTLDILYGSAEHPSSSPPVLHSKCFIPWVISPAPTTHFHYFNKLHICFLYSQIKPELLQTSMPRSLPHIYKPGIVCMCVYMYMWTCLWRSKIDRYLVSSSTMLFFSIFQHRVCHWTWFSPLARLAGSWALGICFHLTSTEITESPLLHTAF